jgi:hypothetical protein
VSPAVTTCRSCRRPVMMLRHERTGRSAPIDRDPVPDGPIIVNREACTYRVLTKADRTDPALGDVARHTNHFQTCPNAKRWKRRKQARR